MTKYYDGSCNFAYTDGQSYKVTWTVGITDNPRENKDLLLNHTHIVHLELAVNENTKAVFDKGRWIRRPNLFGIRAEDRIANLFARNLLYNLY